MVFWVVDQCLMASKPRTHTPPHVERLVRRRPAKSVPTYTRRGAPSPCHGTVSYTHLTLPTICSV
eukprot:14616875-Alexandrium_andersonii.AAC.1